MASVPIEEGKLPFKIPPISQPCETYYKIVGDLSAGQAPLITLHGGPGAGHEYLLPYSDLWTQFKIPVVFYDQIGCAASTHLPQTAGDESFWQVQLFIDELDNLIDQLGLRSGFHLLGQSWGGMFGAAYAASRPKGLRRLVLASGLASQETAMRGYGVLTQQMDTDTRKVLEDGARTGTYDTPEYQAALGAFMVKHLSRPGLGMPPEILVSMRHLEEDKTVYGTVYGPSPLSMTGSLRGWTSIPLLPQINVPTLVFNGEHDSSHDVATAPFFEHIPRVRWITFANASHMCHLDGPDLREKVMRTVGAFLLGNGSETGRE